MRAFAYATTFTSFLLLTSLAFTQNPTACGLSGPNLISNGEFDAGNTAFTSDYNFFPNKICNFGDYTVTSGIFYDPADNCFGVPSFNLQSIWAVEDRNDPGVGNFMIVDPAAANGVTDRIWEQTIPICPNTSYAFSIYAKNVYFLEAPGYSNIDPSFNFRVNGVTITDLYIDGVLTNISTVNLPRQPQADAGVWTQISGLWTSGNETSATLTMNNLVGVEQGNDLAVDGAYFGLCGKTSAIAISSNNLNQCITNNTISPITLTASPETNSSGWLYHEWVKNGVVEQADGTNPIPPYTPAANGDGTYFADYELRVYTDPLGTSCPNASDLLSFAENCVAVFPVEWLDFTATAQEQEVLLRWSTGSELNNQGFEVEVSSDGRMFQKVGWVNGVGNSQEVMDYQFSVENLQLGANYFRLKQVDYNGAFEYSSIIEANLENGLDYSLNISPNPMQDEGYFQLSLDRDVSDISLDIFDMSGKKVQAFYQGPLSGNKQYNFPLKQAELLPGIYLVRVQHAQFVGSKAFVVR